MKLRPRLENTLTTRGEDYGAKGFEQRQLELSRQLTGLVDVLYALVLVEGAVAYRSLFSQGHEFLSIDSLPVLLALVLIYFTTIQSFADYHLASEDQPYQFLSLKHRRIDLWRFYFDVVIVGLYSFVLLRCHVLLESPGADLAWAFFPFPAIFFLYVMWGTLRRKTAQNTGARRQYRDRLLWLCFCLYSGLALMYYLLASHDRIVNSAFLAAALAFMVFFRWMNWRQNRSYPDNAAAA